MQIPYTLIYRKGMKPSGANPVLATGYGAYQYSATPRFGASLLPFLDAGGVYCNANVRGGGEYGRSWHKAGQKATKANTWRDLIAVCETLIADKITSPKHLAIIGSSVGGITVGRALTERPELFAAVISDVGWTNPIRYVAEQNISDIDEWGPMVDATSFKIMYDMDAYQAIKPGTPYPAVLCVTGATDPRVAPGTSPSSPPVCRPQHPAATRCCCASISMPDMAWDRLAPSATHWQRTFIPSCCGAQGSKRSSQSEATGTIAPARPRLPKLMTFPIKRLGMAVS